MYPHLKILSKKQGPPSIMAKFELPFPLPDFQPSAPMCEGQSDEKDCKTPSLGYTALFVIALICITLLLGEKVFRFGWRVHRETQVRLFELLIQ